MESTKLTALLLISMFLVSTATSPVLDCGPCGRHPHPKHPKTPKGPITLPPIIEPPVVLPPITVPPVTGVIPPVTGIVPPVTGIIPPVVGLIPPVVGLIPPVVGGIVPPIVGPPKGGSGGSGCPPPPAPKPSTATCPIDTLKLGACVDLLGGLVHVGLGDPVTNVCCPVIAGLVELEAAVCLCTTLKIKLLNIKIFLPLALELLLTCGKTPPPGFTCTI